VRADAASLRPWEALYADLWPGLVRLGHLLSGSAATGEDLAQEAFLGLLRQGSAVENPRAYLRRSIVNRAANDRRRIARERVHVMGQRDDVTLPPEVDETWQRLRVLPARQRAVLVLRYYEDLTEREIADVLGCRDGTVKSLAARALASLRKDLDQT